MHGIHSPSLDSDLNMPSLPSSNSTLFDLFNHNTFAPDLWPNSNHPAPSNISSTLESLNDLNRNLIERNTLHTVDDFNIHDLLQQDDFIIPEQPAQTFNFYIDSLHTTDLPVITLDSSDSFVLDDLVKPKTNLNTGTGLCPHAFHGDDPSWCFDCPFSLPNPQTKSNDIDTKQSSNIAASSHYDFFVSYFIRCDKLFC